MRYILDDSGLEYGYPETACDRLVYDLTIQQCLDAVARKTGLDLERVLANLLVDQLQAVLLPQGSVIIAGMSRDGLVMIKAASGNLKELTSALPKLERWYRRRGAERFRIMGRHGWEKVLRAQGYTRDGQTLVKEV